MQLPEQPKGWQPEWYASEAQLHLNVRTDQAHRLWVYDTRSGIYTQTEAEWAVHRRVSLMVAQTKKLVPRPRQGKEVVDVLKRNPPTIGIIPPEHIGFANGAVKWPHRQLLAHSPDHLLTYALPHNYDLKAHCPKWQKLLDDIMTVQCQHLLQEVCGAMFWPGKQPKAAVVLVGPSNTGKSTIQEILAWAVGEENVSALSPHQLAQDKFAAAQLFGRVANIVADLPVGHIPDTSVFKQVTGNDLLEADVKYSQPLRFRSTATWLMSTNELPSAGQDRTTGYYGRILPLPMTRVIPDKLLNPMLPGLIMSDPSEMAGIIQWGLQGLARLVSNQMKYTVPHEVRETAERYYLEQNHHLEFLADTYEVAAAGRVSRGNLRADYEKWCEVQGYKPWSTAFLYRRVREEWGQDRKHAGEYSWEGYGKPTPKTAF